MNPQVHILNGDALKEQFPENIEGEIIVARECLVTGNVLGKTLDEFFESRAKFISDSNEGHTKQDYFEQVVPEFEKIQNIEEDVDVNLWFEDDLFCQVNFWFVVNLLNSQNRSNSIFLIRPTEHNQYGFGGLNKEELMDVYTNRLLLTEVNTLASLWGFYQNEETKKLSNTAKELESKYPFILPAVQAHIDRIPSKGNSGRPKDALLQIMKDLKTKEFAPVFQEFCRRENIYGFGDTQVRALLDELVR